jgi:hypothetical protein
MKTVNTNEEIIWHLRNNVFPALTESTIGKIMVTVDAFNKGTLKRHSPIGDGQVSVGEMFEDLKIEIA